MDGLTRQPGRNQKLVRTQNTADCARDATISTV